MDSLNAIYRSLSNRLEAGETVATATVVDTRGSVPREVGAKMIVSPGGSHLGTVGGGCGEYEAIREAMEVIRLGSPRCLTVELNEDFGLHGKGVCGGSQTVLIEAWRPGDPAAAALLRLLLETVERRQPAVLVTPLPTSPPDDPSLRYRSLVLEEGESLRLEGNLGPGSFMDDILQGVSRALSEKRSMILDLGAAEKPVRYFLEVQEQPPTLLIVGAGHIALPLAELGKLCGFVVVVLDDRASFANRDRFPMADRIVAAPFEEALAAFPIVPDTHVVLITRGHQHDVGCLLSLIDRPMAYLGMIGSRRRVRAVFQLLEEAKGIRPERLARVHSPIGLDIGSETPAEIAVSIMAEIIKERRSGTGRSLRDLAREETKGGKTKEV